VLVTVAEWEDIEPLTMLETVAELVTDAEEVLTPCEPEEKELLEVLLEEDLLEEPVEELMAEDVVELELCEREELLEELIEEDVLEEELAVLLVLDEEEEDEAEVVALCNW
jgi:hypothetical protein